MADDIVDLREAAYGAAFLANREDFDKAIDALIAAVRAENVDVEPCPKCGGLLTVCGGYCI
jgi:hypothetical protein